MEIAISTQNLTKTFDRPAGWRRLIRGQGVTAVNDVTLKVQTGELFGLLGPNGAGKTTLVKLLCTLILPTEGTATVAGHPLAHPAAIRRSVGLVVIDERSFYWRLSGRRNLTFFSALHGLYGQEASLRIEALLADMGMESYADEPVSSYSSGMRQRLGIARSLLHQPQILFLDEPSRSLDPRATARLHQLIRDLVSDKRATVFLITHNLREAEDLCDRLAVMDQGRIQVIGEPADLRKQYQPWRHYTVQVDRLDSEIEQSLEQLLPKLDYTTTGELSRLSFKAGEDDGSLMAVLDFLGQNQVAIHSVDSHMPPLEEVFAHFTAT